MLSELLSGTWGRKRPSSPCPALSDLRPFPPSGQLCETPPHPAAPRSPCEGAECQNGAHCVDQGSRPVCQCLPGFGGPECEKLLSVNFVDRDTYLQFTDLQNWPRANITLQVDAQGAGHRGESGGGGSWLQVRDSRHVPAQDRGEAPVSVRVFGCGCQHLSLKSFKQNWKGYWHINPISKKRQEGEVVSWATRSRKPNLPGLYPTISCLSDSSLHLQCVMGFVSCAWSAARLTPSLCL